jgi:hypothetical protein
MKKELTIIGIIPQYPKHSQKKYIRQDKNASGGDFVRYQPDQ